MKKKLLLFLCGLFAFELIQAQISKGGLPFSRTEQLQLNKIPIIEYGLPDWQALLEIEAEKMKNNIPGPYMVGKRVVTDISFPESGIFTTASNGDLVWQAKVFIKGAPAMNLYFDNFYLPQGVQMFLSNANGRQIMGAYDYSNNDLINHSFIHDIIQGDMVNIELNINKSVDINLIKMHVNRVAVHFRAYEHIVRFSDASDSLIFIDAIDDALIGLSSVCHINAICPQGNDYANQRRATLQYLSVDPGSEGVGACSGSMINSIGNTPESCSPYFLLAGHCEIDQATSNSIFSDSYFRFNFETPNCDGTGIITTKSLSGADFVARSFVDMNSSADVTKGDFLLLKLKENIPLSWNVPLIGWDANPSIPLTVTAPQKFIGFHHPAGDAKKVTYSQNIDITSVGALNSHYMFDAVEGYFSQGSSGSSLFDGNGRVIGIASISGPDDRVDEDCFYDGRGEFIPDSVNIVSKYVVYSRLNYVYNYSVDGPADNRKLKPWLDPNNTGALMVNSVKSDCTSLDSTDAIDVVTKSDLSNNVSVYPVPSKDGIVNVQFNFEKIQSLNIEIIDISGKVLQVVNLNNISDYTLGLNLSKYAKGMYFVKINNGNNSVTKKMVLQ